MENPATEESTVLHLGRFIPHRPPGFLPGEEPANDTVTGLVLKAARQISQQSPQPVMAPKTNNALSGPSLLGVVSYCYAKGVYSSDDIERKLRQDPDIRRTCGEAIPDSRTLRRFRRLNRGAIQATLEKLFRFKRKQAGRTLGTACAAPEAGADNSEQSTILFARREAVVRVDTAIIIDSMQDDQ